MDDMKNLDSEITQKPNAIWHRFGAVITGLIIIVLAGTVAFAMQKGINEVPIRRYLPDTSTTNAVWNWQNPLETDVEQTKTQAVFLKRRQINTVFLDISILTGDITPNTYIPTNELLEQRLDDYISVMHKYGIKVYAAAGNTDWSKPQLQYIPLGIARFVSQYNEDHPGRPLDGLEFDIEAYNQGGFNSSSNTEKSLVLTEYLDMVKLLVNYQNTNRGKPQGNFEMGFAIPYWFDNENGNIPSLTWNGKTGPTLFHLLDTLNNLPHSNVVVMAYRNAAAGNDGTIFHARTEIDYAQSKTPRVGILIGQELTAVEPAKITFYNQSMAQLSSEIAIISNEFKGSTSFSGFALNDLNGFETLDDTN